MPVPLPFFHAISTQISTTCQPFHLRRTSVERLVLLVSGIVIWQPWFAPLFSIGATRVAAVIHAFTAFVLIAGIIVHIYAVIWVKGTLRGMTRGTVTRAWAKYHYPGWYRQVTKGTK